jgi:hypothetical protein
VEELPLGGSEGNFEGILDGILGGGLGEVLEEALEEGLKSVLIGSFGRGLDVGVDRDAMNAA